jgi:hypothetical protein
MTPFEAFLGYSMLAILVIELAGLVITVIDHFKK